ncbi:hypothetical protein TPHA_0A02340 [Tetrapisispora phaffii CBS 4417]|uniref:protein-serine/threonine phosphatase n=1 Tax=Tetrapisispora phaffii (strain ATCC 24235 / CBS 4417 / NBRC 1672 / NRRL Y-8282 / UCD 70-5) TaxID=1071381 RepID=G8BN38_TETPH|nr:hypothetical protein TPHA_0A02340 [Tetrapisispora phaffii CBS 4417]CCE61316.1 hypothetical protein TPHA_0A02340 [Tetrapisispora phaffii CBS 4417]
MGQLLSHPLTEKSIIYNDYKHCTKLLESNHRNSITVDDDSKYQTPRYFNCIGSMQGYRLTQEDAHLIVNDNYNDSSQLQYVQFYNPFKDKMENLKLSIFGVFDGHGSDECSNFISGEYGRQLCNNNNGNGKKNKKKKNSDDKSNKDIDSDEDFVPASEQYKQGLAKWIKYSFENHLYGVEGILIKGRKVQRGFKTLEGLISQILKDSYMLQDQELFKYYSRSSSGSTAVVAIIINDKNLYVANCGDSRCVLSSKSNGTKTMSFDHKPQHIGELLRINDNGGTVSLGRVGGVLALSRAFGDFQFKRNIVYNKTTPVQVLQNMNGSEEAEGSEGGILKHTGIPAQESQVTVEPDVLMHKINYSKDEFLVLACDGIWDVYSNKQLVNFIKYHLTLGIKLDSIITKLLDHGIAQANSDTGIGFDNMTVIIVILNKPGESLSDWYAKMKARLEREKGIV